MNSALEIINCITDRIVWLEGGLAALRNLRGEMLNASADAAYRNQPCQTEAPAPASTAPIATPRSKGTTGSATPAAASENPGTPARRRINITQSVLKPAGKAKAEGGDDSVAARVCRYIDAQEAEFGTAAVVGDVGNRLGVTYKAITSAIQSLRRKGMIRTVRHGWWEKTPRWSPSGSTPSTKEQEYATFSAGLNIKVPEIEGAAPTQH